MFLSFIAHYEILGISRYLSLNILGTNIQQIKQIAREHQANLIEYSIVENNNSHTENNKESYLYIWVVKPTGDIYFRKVNLSASNILISDLVKESRNSIFRSKEYLQPLHKLYKVLIQPIEDLLPTDPQAHIILIPYGSLFLVPFSALVDIDGHYLIEKHTLLTAPSIQSLSLTRQNLQRIKKFSRNILVIGNPALIQPPFSKVEALTIAKLYGTQAITGQSATKDFVVKHMTQSGMIHMATQAHYIDDSSGSPSFISLTPSTMNDGSLNSNEILDMKLHANLVVLSGCNTARGIVTSDGVVGLPRSFMIAGVPSIIASLWSIGDPETSDLMIEFHRNLKLRGLDKAQSLRQAMLTEMKTYPSPKNWAGFILIGESQ